MTSETAAQRRESLWAAVALLGVDGFLVSSITNIGYLTGFSGSDAALLLTRDRSLIVSDGRYTTQIEEECRGLPAHIRPTGQLMGDGLAEILGKLGLRSIGFESAVVSVADHQALQAKLPSVDLRGLTDLVENLRVVKDPTEIAEIREAIAYAERAFAQIRVSLSPEQSEKDVADAIEMAVRRTGATATAFSPIVGVGKNGALPHHKPSPDTKIGDDDFVLIDWGAMGRPYKSDLTRVLVTGKVTPKFEEVYRVVLEANERGIAAIRPGVTGREVDAEARAVIAAKGFGDFFNHGLGHGLGRDIHEAPRLRQESDVVLRPGMIVTVEPGIYLPNWGGVRIEDDVLVTEDGCEVLTRVPKALETVRAS